MAAGRGGEGRANTPSGWRSAVNVFATPRVLLLTALGFSSGLPLYLTGQTLQAWMTREGVSLETIGIFSLVGMPYTLKFLWAPLVDRYGLGVLGRRRGWMAATQALLLLAIGVLGTLNPSTAPLAVASVALGVALLSATQDISVDAYRTDLLPERERAAGTATFVMGYRLALIAAGAGALILSDHLGWRTVYWVMAGLMLLGVAATLRAPEPQGVPAPPSLAAAVIDPLREWFSRPAAVSVLVFLVLYKCGDEVARGMITSFLVKQGFSNTEIGAVNQGFGMAATIVGVFFAGGFVAKLGVRRALLVFGILQAATNGLYLLLALGGKSYALLWASIGADNLTGGMATAAFVAFLMGLCDRRFTATQYALLSSLAAFGGRLLSSGSGYVAERVGWPGFFAVTIALAVPGLVMLRFLPQRLRPEEEQRVEAPEAVGSAQSG